MKFFFKKGNTAVSGKCTYYKYVLFFLSLFLLFSLLFVKIAFKINASKFHTFGSSIFPFFTSSPFFFVFLVYHCNDYIFINLYHIPPISTFQYYILRYLYCTVQLFPLDPFFCDFLSFECNLLTLFKCSFNEVTPTCAINSGNKSFRITL